ncbi:unnamed protein product [Lymnaea stagnalis]|uniref:PDZ domain-containing protein n=1 Tax=Lymnaea stagnalis TaxID=6523 RepID=A0AAV2I1K2_LYMST
MSLVAESQTAADYLEILQRRLWMKGDHSQDEDLSSIIVMLESPLFRQLLTLQESLQELGHVSQTHPLTEDSFDLTSTGELIMNESSDGFTPENVADSSTLKVRGKPFNYAAPQLSSLGYEPEVERSIHKLAAGRPVHVIKLVKQDNMSLGFSVIGISKESKNEELGIYVRDIQPDGIAGR